MSPQDPYQTAPSPEVHNPLSVMQPGEQVICSVKRHPFGMFGTYFIAGVLLIILAVLAFIAVPSVISSDSGSQATAVGTVVFFIGAVFILGFVFIANKVYWGNSWVVTSDSVTQVTQTGLFDKQSAQLSLGNLEDVTAEQNGLPAQLLNYGTLKIETAGHREKFVFPFCPDPTHYAQKILAVRELFEQTHHNQVPPAQPQADTAYQPPIPPPQPAQSPPTQPVPLPDYPPQSPVAPYPVEPPITANPVYPPPEHAQNYPSGSGIDTTNQQ